MNCSDQKLTLEMSVKAQEQLELQKRCICAMVRPICRLKGFHEAISPKVICKLNSDSFFTDLGNKWKIGNGPVVFFSKDILLSF